MANSYIGEVKAFPYNSIIPEGWVECDGRKININNMGDYTKLFYLIYYAYGGGPELGYFCIPNLQGVTPIGAEGNASTMGQTSGTETVELSYKNTPPHQHVLSFQALGYGQAPQEFSQAPVKDKSYGGRYWMNISGNPPFNSDGTFSKYYPNVEMSPGSLSWSDGGAAHENRQPYLAMRFCICYDGIFPSRAD